LRNQVDELVELHGSPLRGKSKFIDGEIAPEGRRRGLRWSNSPPVGRPGLGWTARTHPFGMTAAVPANVYAYPCSAAPLAGEVRLHF
jgi:hypothetical protein